ncbi:MAG: hypothetical protein R6T90_00685 [Dissulfuribacterales bacterium]
MNLLQYLFNANQKSWQDQGHIDNYQNQFMQQHAERKGCNAFGEDSLPVKKSSAKNDSSFVCLYSLPFLSVAINLLFSSYLRSKSSPHHFLYLYSFFFQP